MKFDVIAFDADDTLWHNETLFAATKDKFKTLLSPYCSPQTIQEQLDHTEIRIYSILAMASKVLPFDD
jgi:putative hydrolase of the HAD superfamily